MSYKSEGLIAEIRKTREDSGVSQRALSARSGLTQSHISKIERGTLEPGLSSLIDMARALDLELVVVPKKLLPAVKGILRTTKAEQELLEGGKEALHEIERGERLVNKQKALYGSSADLDRIAESLRFLRHAPLRSNDREIIQDALRTLNKYQAGKQSRGAVKEIAATLLTLRNRIAHGQSEAKQPAYALPDDEDDDA